MDIMTLQRKNFELANRFGSCVPSCDGDGAKEDRINSLVKQTTIKKPTKNKWGSNDYPIDVGDYGQFLSSLQTLSWVLRDLNYDISYLTKGGLHYSGTDYLSYPGLFDRQGGKILALVAIGKDGRHYRFNRVNGQLRIRKYDNITRAIAPMRDNDTSGTRPISPQIAKEIVRVMKTQSILNPADPLSLRRWGRVVQNKSLKPVGAGVLKSLLKLQFRKV